MSGISHYSTDTALVKVINDLLPTSDQGSVSLFVLLDLRTFLDITYHTILLDRPENVKEGVKEVALFWLKSYLTNLYQVVDVNRILYAI